MHLAYQAYLISIYLVALLANLKPAAHDILDMWIGYIRAGTFATLSCIAPFSTTRFFFIWHELQQLMFSLKQANVFHDFNQNRKTCLKYEAMTQKILLLRLIIKTF